MLSKTFKGSLTQKIKLRTILAATLAQHIQHSQEPFPREHDWPDTYKRLLAMTHQGSSQEAK